MEEDCNESQTLHGREESNSLKIDTDEQPIQEEDEVMMPEQ